LAIAVKDATSKGRCRGRAEQFCLTSSGKFWGANDLEMDHSQDKRKYREQQQEADNGKATLTK